MSGSYGITGKTSHPVIHDACKKVAEACRRFGKSAGMHIVKPDEDTVDRALRDGFTFIALGMDTVYLDEASCKALKSMIQKAGGDYA